VLSSVVAAGEAVCLGPNGCQQATRPVRLFAGRLIKKKGIYDVLEATALLQQSLPCRLAIVGKGPEAASIRRRTLELGSR
jgi:glycosyltransferase involved in cell wall biosynthesis